MIKVIKNKSFSEYYEIYDDSVRLEEVQGKLKAKRVATKLAKKLNIEPGNEFLVAIKTAEEMNIPIELCDRDIRITLRRTWKSLSIIEKFRLLLSGDDSEEIETTVNSVSDELKYAYLDGYYNEGKKLREIEEMYLFLIFSE